MAIARSDIEIEIQFINSVSGVFYSINGNEGFDFYAFGFL